MPKSYWTKIQTPDGLKYFRADDVTDELLQKLKDVVYVNKQSPDFNFSNISDLISQGKRVVVTWSGMNGSSYYDVSVKSSSSIKFACVENGEYRVLTLNSDGTSSAETHGISDNLEIFSSFYSEGAWQWPSYSEISAAHSEGKTCCIVQTNPAGAVDVYWLKNKTTGQNIYFRFEGINGRYVDIKSDNSVSDGVLYDDQLKSNSTNAVQNKTLYAIINDLQSRVSALEGN